MPQPTALPRLPSTTEVKERVELYLYSPSGPAWPVLGRIFTFSEALKYAKDTGSPKVQFLYGNNTANGIRRDAIHGLYQRVLCFHSVKRFRSTRAHVISLADVRKLEPPLRRLSQNSQKFNDTYQISPKSNKKREENGQKHIDAPKKYGRH